MRLPARIAVCSSLAALLLGVPAAAQEDRSAASEKLYNTAKQKLLDGKQVNGHTISRADPEAYCEAAKHYDFTWFEMQHSTLTYADVERMIAACPKVGAIPMIRVPDAIAGLPARMLLQVHDELLFEVAEGAVDETAAAVRRVMEGAAMPAVALDVPLVVDAGHGPTWAAAH